jgi:hypothetical protein
MYCIGIVEVRGWQNRKLLGLFLNCKLFPKFQNEINLFVFIYCLLIRGKNGMMRCSSKLKSDDGNL